MIYCLDMSKYPEQKDIIEEVSYQDENDFEWVISRTVSGFIVRYLGDSYFCTSFFVCRSSSDTKILVKNTNCLFIADVGFETFSEVRTIIKNGCTDDIWDELTRLFNERLKHDNKLLDLEIVK